MNISKESNSGYSFVIVAVILGILAIIGVSAFKLYKYQHKSSSTQLATTVSDTAAKSNLANIDRHYTNLIQENGGVAHVLPEKIAKTQDQIAILTSLHYSCKSTAKYVSFKNSVFTDSSDFRIDGTHAFIHASACDPKANTVNELDRLGGGSSAAIFLHKSKDELWHIDAGSLDGVDCAQVDGRGYPVTIIDTCYDAETTSKVK